MRRFVISAAILMCSVLTPYFGAMAADVCPRFAAGSDVQAPPDSYSSARKLHVALNYWTTVDDAGRTLFCYESPAGLASPALHGQPAATVRADPHDTLPP